MALCSGCAATPVATRTATGHDAIRIVAVERVYGDIARQIGETSVDVTTILNSPSADPHAYEPTTQDAEAIGAADIVVQNGLGYDAFSDKLIDASPRAGRSAIVVGALGGHRVGDNPHVWYQMRTMRAYAAALARAIVSRAPRLAKTVARRHAALDTWFASVDLRLARIAASHGGTAVAITEPVFDYVLDAARLTIATPSSFSHAIEEGNDPAPQDVEHMRTLLAAHEVRAFVYNDQTIEPSTTRLLADARAANVTVVPVTETLPSGLSTQAWIDGEIEQLRKAL